MTGDAFNMLLSPLGENACAARCPASDFAPRSTPQILTI
jgi:hypothetical protein